MSYRKLRWHLYIAEGCMPDLCSRGHSDTHGMKAVGLSDLVVPRPPKPSETDSRI